MTARDDQLAELPPVDILTERQVRGADCVFCSVVLRAGALRDLRPRVVEVHGTRTYWFPRSCRTCPKEQS